MVTEPNHAAMAAHNAPAARRSERHASTITRYYQPEIKAGDDERLDAIEMGLHKVALHGGAKSSHWRLSTSDGKSARTFFDLGQSL